MSQVLSTTLSSVCLCIDSRCKINLKQEYNKNLKTALSNMAILKQYQRETFWQDASSSTGNHRTDDNCPIINKKKWNLLNTESEYLSD